MLNRVWRLARNGLAAALAVGVAGWALERSRFGASDDDALRRMEAELRQRLASSAETLGAMSARVGAEREAIRMAPRDPAAVRRLFDAVEAVIPAEESGRTGLTVYARDGSPLAWAGRASDLPRDRLDGPQALFVAPGALGPRLVRVEPVVSADRTAPGRPATIVVERLLGSPQGTRVVTDAVIVSTAIAPASLRAHFGDAASRPPYTFLIPSPGGGVLVDAEVAPADLARAHAQWRNGTWAAVWIIVAATLLLCAGPLLDQRQRMRDRTGFSIVTSTIVLTLLAARLVLRFGMAAIVDRQMTVSPVDLLLNAMLVTALTWLALDILERWRVGRPRPRLLTLAPSSLLMLGLAFAAAGAVDSWILVAYERFLERFVSGTTLDLLHFSLHPISATRLAIACGLVLLHASVMWTAAAVPTRFRRRSTSNAIRPPTTWRA